MLRFCAGFGRNTSFGVLWTVVLLHHGCVCVPLVITGIPLDCFSFLQRGAEHSGNYTQRSYPLVLEAEPDQLCVPAGILTFPELSLTLRRLARYVVTLSFRLRLASLALFPLEDLQAPMVLTGTLRTWNPRPACGTAVSSVHPILSVFGYVWLRANPG